MAVCLYFISYNTEIALGVYLPVARNTMLRSQFKSVEKLLTMYFFTWTVGLAILHVRALYCFKHALKRFWFLDNGCLYTLIRYYNASKTKNGTNGTNNQ